MANLPPLSLYIHIPWCVQKCPYCDFNSHALKGEVPHDDYVAHLLADLDADVPYAQDVKLRPFSLVAVRRACFLARRCKRCWTACVRA